MNHPRRRATLTCLAAGLLTAALPAVSAAAYPDKPIRLVVPFPPGQGADILARLIGQHLAAALGQPIVVENKVGAGGIIGTAFAAKAAPDGYTLYMGSSGPLAIGPHVYKAVGFDTLKDWFHSEDPDKVSFTSEFRAARAGKHIELHNDVQNTDDWRAKIWILERTNDDYRVEGHGAFGLRPSDMAQPLNEKQIEHRFIQALAFPTSATQKVIREAFKRGNPTFHALIDECVKARPLLAEGTEAPEPGEALELAPRVHTTTPELTARIAAFLDVLDAHPRVALGGGPECGKTTVFAPATQWWTSIGSAISTFAGTWTNNPPRTIASCHAAYFAEPRRASCFMKYSATSSPCVASASASGRHTTPSGSARSA